MQKRIGLIIVICMLFASSVTVLAKEETDVRAQYEDYEARFTAIKNMEDVQKNGFEIKLVKKGYYSDGEDAYFMMLGEC